MGVGSIAGLSAVVESAVRSAAGVTGVDFGFLLRTAKRESGFNPLAHAGSSSAAGLFQFVEQTWMPTSSARPTAASACPGRTPTGR